MGVVKFFISNAKINKKVLFLHCNMLKKIETNR